MMSALHFSHVLQENTKAQVEADCVTSNSLFDFKKNLTQGANIFSNCDGKIRTPAESE